MPYVGLEHMASESPHLIGWSPSGSSISTNSVFLRSDVLFGKLRPNLRKCVLAPFAGYCSTDILVLRPRHGIHPSFAAKVFLSDDVFREAVATAVGTKMPRTSWGALKDVGVFCPVESEQRHIATILDTLDDAILRTEGIIAKLQHINQALHHDLLSRGVDEGGGLRPSPIDAPRLYADSPIGTLPLRWASLPLNDACSLIKDGTHLPPKRVDDGPLLLSVRNMQDGSFILTPEDTRVSWTFYRSMHRDWSILEGDVLLAIVGATLGKTAIVPPMPPFTLQRSVAVLRGRVGVVLSSHLKLCVDSPLFQTRLWQAANQTAQPGIYLQQLGLIRIPCPPFEEQERIEAVWEAAEAPVASEVHYVGKLRLLRRGLADDLLTGRVRVLVPTEATA